MRGTWIVMGCGLLTLGCQTGRPTYSVAVAPNWMDIRPTKSVLFVETPLPMASVAARIDQALGQVLGPGGVGQVRLGIMGGSYRLSRGALTVSAIPAGLALGIPIVGDLALGSAFLQCRASGLGGTFRFAARPTLDAAGDLILAQGQLSVEPVGQLRCAGLQVPTADVLTAMTSPVQSALASALQELKLPTGSAVQRGLSELATPRGIEVSGQPACLDLAPSGLVLSPTGDRTSLRVGFEVAPRLNLGACPVGQGGALPRQVTMREDALGDSFRVPVAIAASQGELAERVRPLLLGKRLGSGATAVTVTAVEVGDVQGQTLLRLDVVGGYTGTLFLWGTPAIEQDQGRWLLRVPNLRLAAESESMIQNAKMSLYQLWEGDLAARIRPMLTLDVTSKLESLRTALSSRMTLQGTRWQPALASAGVGNLGLRSTLTELVPQGVESKPGVLVLHLLVVGKLTLEANNSGP